MSADAEPRVILETPRMILRELGPDDAAFAFELNADPDVLRHTGDPPFASIEAARAFLEAYDDYRRNGCGRWGAVLREENALVGWCGLKLAGGDVDLGFRFFRRVWGRGLATEAAAACLAHGFDILGFDRIVGRAMEENVASWRVLEKVGMRFACRFEEDGATWRLYESLAPQPSDGASR